MTATSTYVFQIYAEGLLYTSVCTSLTDEQATNRVNDANPTGIPSHWRVADEPFASGEPNPNPCEDFPDTHRHILFAC